MIHHKHCTGWRHSAIHIGREREAQMHVSTVLVMLFVKLVTVVGRVFHKLGCVIVINGVTVGMLLVGHMRSLSHSDHQGVIEN